VDFINLGKKTWEIWEWFWKGTWFTVTFTQDGYVLYFFWNILAVNKPHTEIPRLSSDVGAVAPGTDPHRPMEEGRAWHQGFLSGRDDFTTRRASRLPVGPRCHAFLRPARIPATNLATGSLI
jgi:hypothetical protein